MTREPYPTARRDDIVDDLHGTPVPDPYRWLEDPDDPATREWLDAQSDLFAKHMAATPRRDAFRDRITELVRSGTVGAPVWRGERRFAMRRTPDQEHAVLYTADPGGAERALLDPVAMDPSGLTTVDSWQPDKEGRALAYQISVGGDEESKLHVIDVATGELLDGPIDRCRYSPWRGSPAARRSTTSAGSRRVTCRPARSSTTAGCTSTVSAPPSSRTS